MKSVILVNNVNEHIESWYREADTGYPTIVYFQGNAGNISDRIFKADIFAKEGFGFFLTGYRGFGNNNGKPTEKGLYNDALIALKYLKSSGISYDKLILYGESLGSAVAVEMAFRFANTTPVLGVVLEAPFTSMLDAAQDHYPYIPVKILLKDKYDSISKISRINAPLLIFHGEEDNTVSILLGKKLFNAASSPKYNYWVPSANHSNLFDFDASSHISDFLQKISR